MERIASLSEFWPHYLSEHRHPVSRVLHFIGTTSFFLAVLSRLAHDPLRFGAAMGLACAAAAIGAYWVEPRQAGFLPMIGVVLPLLISSPLPMLAAIVCAYACAWVGHFCFEHNRPATFRYPVWSLLCDFRMWSLMARGSLWTALPAGPR